MKHIFTFTLNTGTVKYEVVAGGTATGVVVEVLDMKGKTGVSGNQMNGQLTIPDVQLWWPYTMSGKNFTYMYTLKVRRSMVIGVRT